MRREHQIGKRTKRAVGRERFDAEHIEHGAAELIGLEGGLQRGLFDHAAAREVHHHRAGRQSREFTFADHAARFVGERHVQREDVRFAKQGVERGCAAYTQRGEPLSAIYGS